jgi:hypothetical protein
LCMGLMLISLSYLLHHRRNFLLLHRLADFHRFVSDGCEKFGGGRFFLNYSLYFFECPCVFKLLFSLYFFECPCIHV